MSLLYNLCRFFEYTIRAVYLFHYFHQEKFPLFELLQNRRPPSPLKHFVISWPYPRIQTFSTKSAKKNSQFLIPFQVSSTLKATSKEKSFLTNSASHSEAPKTQKLSPISMNSLTHVRSWLEVENVEQHLKYKIVIGERFMDIKCTTLSSLENCLKLSIWINKLKTALANKDE